jgi:NTP pyrophosphatase (non-canonical NTP hydrolase)
MNDLQERAVDWHIKRFPDAEAVHVALKMCEEAGEVCRALNGELGKNSATGYGDVCCEVADVIIAAMVLAGRYYNIDIAHDIDSKLKILTDPNSGHRARLRE